MFRFLLIVILLSDYWFIYFFSDQVIKRWGNTKNGSVRSRLNFEKKKLVGSGYGNSTLEDSLDTEEVSDDFNQGPRGSDDSQAHKSAGDAVPGFFGLTFVTTGGNPLDTTPDQV